MLVYCTLCNTTYLFDYLIIYCSVTLLTVFKSIKLDYFLPSVARMRMNVELVSHVLFNSSTAR